MADATHVALLLKGALEWNCWREENDSIFPDLTEAVMSGDLSGANLDHAQLARASLRGAQLTRANLSHATLIGANLFDADLAGANLTGATLDSANCTSANLSGAQLARANLGHADLFGAELIGANLTYADLSGANLTCANLSYAQLTHANLGGANLSDAVINETVFAATLLDGVVGLGTCTFLGPSAIDHRTIGQNWPLPLTFLRGCGLPDNLIDFLPSLLSTAIEFYSCFISYSTADQEFAERLHADLQNKGVRCWFAPHNIHGGKKIHEQIDEAIRVYDRLLLIVSPSSMKSDWVETEISKARKREGREGRRMLFPVRVIDFEAIQDWECFDADTGKDSAREIREYFIPDFSNWKDHDSYKLAFDRLLADLKAESAP